MSKGDKAADSANTRGKSLPARRQNAEIIPAVGFTRVEKNLASLGFFTASSKTVRGTQEKKITLVRRDAGSKSIEATATILPSHKYGLPITSDQDKYLALLKIVAEIRREKGKVKSLDLHTEQDSNQNRYQDCQRDNQTLVRLLPGISQLSCRHLTRL